MSEFSEKEWKKALTSILEELDDPQYKKMLEYLERIPKGQKMEGSKEKMPKTIIEYYGFSESVSEINDAMNQVPRRDCAVQDLLSPFVNKLREENEKQSKGKKRKHESDSELKDKNQKPAAGFKKNNVKSDSESSDEEEDSAADQHKNCKPVEERKNQTWRKTINDLNTGGDLGQKAITVRVVQKSVLRSYQTQEKVEKLFFYLVVADETGSIKMMVYGKEHYQKIIENHSYLFKNVILEKSGYFHEKMIKVIEYSTVSRMSDVDVPEEMKLDAQRLIYRQNPVHSITKAKEFAKKTTLTTVSVKGKVMNIGSVTPVILKSTQEKKERQDFTLKDDTDEIRISLWGEDINQFRGISDGDLVEVQSAAAQPVKIEIISITSANKKETNLEAVFEGELQAFVVSSKHLAKAFGVKLGCDFEENLLQIKPLSAKAEIQGSKINKIRAG
ncbi:uncharacterized protein LOC108891514 isoform X2 [Lates calcarifer]|uniref:Uncharacterized protein LOC108891514 isoform X2 n=1 Tax=Lates calcarifer TaxID=8187 RepID=A0AAJ7Q1G2_LATCA|nr:uncharacterized protein LOC108891514 isoform X2 [Lates calcarifer]